MRHKVRRTGFGKGKDANVRLVRQLVLNFLKKGKMTTTETRAKVLKTHVDRLMAKLTEKTEANLNSVLRYTGSMKAAEKLYSDLSETAKKAQGGHVTTKKLLFRKTDGASMVQVSWARPVVLDTGESKPAEKESNKSAKKSEDKS